MNSCPKCKSESLYNNASNRTIKCRACGHINYADKFFTTEDSPEQSLLKKFGFASCWHCKENFKHSDVREID
mgnify:CR=1 FL=1